MIPTRYFIKQKLRSFNPLLKQNPCRLLHEYIQVSPLQNDIYNINLNKPPVNTLNLEMLQEVTDAIHMLEKQDDCKAAIFTSNFEAFSAGFDFNEMLQPNLKRLRDFWNTVLKLALTIKKTPLVTASAINGSCIAGGCVFPFLSDISVMNKNDNLRIGLSATIVGIVPPDILLIPMQEFIGHRKTELLSSLSLLVSPTEAYNMKLIHQLADHENVVPEAINSVKEYLKIPDVGRIATKQMFSRHFLQQIDNKKKLEEEARVFAAHVMKPEIQSLIENRLASLKKL